MQHVDERILEHLAESLWSTPGLMSAFHLDASEERVDEWCRVLARLGYIAPARDNPPEEAVMWEIDVWGERYLSGDVDADLMRPTPAPRPPEAVRPRHWSGCV